MDELTLLQGFRAERVADVPEAREAIWRALEARIDAAVEGAAGASSRGASPAPARSARRGFFSRRRRLLAFATALGAAVAVAGVLVLNSGPTAQPAAAEILHEAATVAAASDAPAELPGPGQFYFRKISRVELVSWLPPGVGGNDEPGSMGGGVLPQPGAFKALLPTTNEDWLDSEGAGRFRQVAGMPRFFTDEERSAWEAAGSPPPGEPVLEDEHGPWKGYRFPDTSSLPTDPAELRRAVEANAIEVKGFNLMFPKEKRLDEKQTTEELTNILLEGNPLRPQLRAAIFNALAELPRIKVDTEATDFLGRQGDSIRLVDEQSGGGAEFIFDPETSEVLANREFLLDPKGDRYLQGVPPGTTLRETDYLETAVVDSTHETGAKPTGGTGPQYEG
jgi:hypothetical protein